MDRLILSEIAAACRVGVFEWERTNPQDIAVDVEIPIDAAATAADDRLEDAVDYARLVSLVREVAQRKPYALLETLADELARAVLREFRVRSVRLQVKKRALPGVGYAAVVVERSGRMRRGAPRRVSGARAARG